MKKRNKQLKVKKLPPFKLTPAIMKGRMEFVETNRAIKKAGKAREITG